MTRVWCLSLAVLATPAWATSAFYLGLKPLLASRATQRRAARSVMKARQEAQRPSTGLSESR